MYIYVCVCCVCVCVCVCIFFFCWSQGRRSKYFKMNRSIKRFISFLRIIYLVLTYGMFPACYFLQRKKEKKLNSNIQAHIYIYIYMFLEICR